MFIQPGLFDQCTEVPDHMVGIIGVRPTYGDGALYKEIAQEIHERRPNHSDVDIRVRFGGECSNMDIRVRFGGYVKSAILILIAMHMHGVIGTYWYFVIL